MELPVEPTIKLAFTGDVCFNGIFKEKLLKGEPVVHPDIVKLFQDHDAVIINLEGPATELPGVKTNGTNLANPPEAITYLNSIGVNVYGLANNHTFDSSGKAVKETKLLITNSGAQAFGAGGNYHSALEPANIVKGDLSASLYPLAMEEGPIAVHGVAGVYGEQFADKHVEIFSKKSNSMHKHIVVYHGGTEFTQYPAPPKRKLFRILSDADAIVGHHSHTIQGAEQMGNCFCAYSLGNFIFDMPQHRTHTEASFGAILSLEVTEQQITPTWHYIYTDTKAGLVRPITESDLPFKMADLNDWPNYNKHWAETAHKAIFGKTTTAAAAETTQKRPPRILRTGAWKRAYNMMGDKYNRALLFGALRYKLYTKLGIWK